MHDERSVEQDSEAPAFCAPVTSSDVAALLKAVPVHAAQTAGQFSVHPNGPQPSRNLAMELEVARKEIARLQEQNKRLRKCLRETTRQVEEARLHANYDELTGLPNRRLFKDRMRQALANAARKRRLVALVLIDLNGFKAVNDTLGHAVGDEVLRIIAERLQGSVRLADTVCRYGGDEFVILFPDLDDIPSVDAVTSKIRTCFDQPCMLAERSLTVRASVGCAVYPDDAEEMGDLLKRADKAMYSIKAREERRSDQRDEVLDME